MKYVFYVNTGNSPRARAKEYLADLKADTIAALSLDMNRDKLLMVSVSKNEPTRLEVLVWEDDATDGDLTIDGKIFASDSVITVKDYGETAHVCQSSSAGGRCDTCFAMMT
jgi:hypothetical protein